MVNVPSSDNSKMVATFRATKTSDWPTTCGLVIFCAASVNLYSEVHVPITVSF